MLTKAIPCGIIDKHSSREQKPKTRQTVNQAVFGERREQTQHNIKKLSSKRPRKKLQKSLKKSWQKQKDLVL